MTPTPPHDPRADFNWHPVRSKDGTRIRQSMLDFLAHPAIHRKVNTNFTLAGRKPQPSAESDT